MRSSKIIKVRKYSWTHTSCSIPSWIFFMFHESPCSPKSRPLWKNCTKVHQSCHSTRLINWNDRIIKKCSPRMALNQFSLKMNFYLSLNLDCPVPCKRMFFGMYFKSLDDEAYRGASNNIKLNIAKIFYKQSSVYILKSEGYLSQAATFNRATNEPKALKPSLWSLALLLWAIKSEHCTRTCWSRSWQVINVTRDNI